MAAEEVAVVADGVQTKCLELAVVIPDRFSDLFETVLGTFRIGDMPYRITCI